MSGKTIVVGVSGASGAVYAKRLAELLAADKRVARVFLIVSSGGVRLLKEELGLAPKNLAELPAALVGRAAAKKFTYLHNADIGAPLASGSYPTDGMVILPCSLATLGAVASGVSDNLIRRAADVHLKEGRPLLLCWRDSPLNTIHLENMLRVAQAGGVNFPISPGYYFGMKSLDELVTQFCCRVLARLGLPQEKQRQWRGTKA